MDWTEIIISVEAAFSDTAAAIANMVVPYGIYIEDYSDMEEVAPEIAHIDLIDEELLKKDKTRVNIHIYIAEEENAFEAVAFLRERLRAEGIDAKVEKTSVNDKEWAENWKKYFKPTEIGKRLAICPSWENYDNRENRKILKIDPGAAFGTGTHATTSMCLEVLDEYIEGGETILDVGCGSGILSIAGVLLGAKNAIGVDIDAQSVKVSRENAEMNDLSGKTEYICGNLTDKVDGKFSVVCANIVADVIISLCDGIDKYMEEDALFICSGIIDLRADEVKAVLDKNGFVIIKECVKENWNAFVTRKVR